MENSGRCVWYRLAVGGASPYFLAPIFLPLFSCPYFPATSWFLRSLIANPEPLKPTIHPRQIRRANAIRIRQFH